MGFGGIGCVVVMSDISSGNDWEFVMGVILFYFFLDFIFNDVGVEGGVEGGFDGGN